MRTLGLFIILFGSLAGCGDSSDEEPAGDCSAVTTAETCSNAVFDEIEKCMGGERPSPDVQLVHGTFSADGATCSDVDDPERVATFNPPAPQGDKNDWAGNLAKLTVRRGTTECGTVVFSTSGDWKRDVTSASGTFSVGATNGTLVSWTCPSGEQGDLGAAGKDCDAHLPLGEGYGGGTTDAQYAWGPLGWFFCTVP